MAKVRDITAMRIRDRRIELGMTQDELAMKAGYNGRSSINKIEREARNVPLERIAMIAKALRCSPEYLMGWDTDSVPLGVDIELENAKQIDVDLLPRDKTEEMMIRIYRLLSPEDKETVTKLIERLAPREQA